MRYLIITTMGPFYSNWILEPNWAIVIMIIDTDRSIFVGKQHDHNKDGKAWSRNKLRWENINFDHL